MARASTRARRSTRSLSVVERGSLRVRRRAAVRGAMPNCSINAARVHPREPDNLERVVLGNPSLAMSASSSSLAGTRRRPRTRAASWRLLTALLALVGALNAGRGIWPLYRCQMAPATPCLRLGEPERGYTWVTVRHSKSRRPRVPSRIQKGIPDLGVAGCTGLEPVASGVTGRRYNQLN